MVSIVEVLNNFLCSSDIAGIGRIETCFGASLTVKLLSDESIFSSDSDDDDIRKVSRRRIANMLYGAERQDITPVDISVVHVGRKAINIWIWDNLIEKNITINLLKDYLQRKLKQDAWIDSSSLVL